MDASAHLPVTDIDNDAGTVRAVVTDSSAEVANVDVAVTFRDATAETVELTSPANGATATFTSGTLTVTGTASAGASSVELFYSTTAAAGTDPVYAACGTATTTGATTKTFSGTCTIGAVAPSTVTAIAARVGNGANQSGDAHRVTGAGTAGTTPTTTTPTTQPGGSQPAGEQGYALVAADGGIFNFGTSRFFGSTGSLRLNRPIVGMDRTPSTQGSWLVASDGGIFAFGDARFAGSTGAITLARPIVGMRSHRPATTALRRRCRAVAGVLGERGELDGGGGHRRPPRVAARGDALATDDSAGHARSDWKHAAVRCTSSTDEARHPRRRDGLELEQRHAGVGGPQEAG